MAYNKINYYKKVLEVQKLTRELKEEGVSYKEIYWQHIQSKFHISYKTFNNYLGIPAGRELKKLQDEMQ